MSYCRFSSNNFKCQVYCYEDVNGGWTTHVAAIKHVGQIPELPPFPTRKDDKAGFDAYLKAHQAQMAWLATCERAPLGLPYDGQSFNDATLEEFLDRLLMLRAAGYSFPDFVLDAVREEIDESRRAPLAEREE